MNKNNTIKNLILSLIINILIMVFVMAVTNMLYETNDDYAIASRLVDGYAEVNFVNYYLCRILIPLQQAAGTINVYVIAQIAFSFIAFTVLLKIILDNTESRIIRAAAALVTAVFSFDHYCTIQFTKTAAILIIAASILIVDNMVKKGSALRYLGGLLLLYAGVAFRVDGLIAAIGFAGIFVLNWIILHRKDLKTEGYLAIKNIVVYVIVIAAVLGSYGFDNLSYKANIATDELRAYKEYSELRSDIVDYPVYDYYEDNAAAYEAIGISENDLYLIDRWYFDYDGAASSQNLDAIIEVDKADIRPAYTIRQAVMKFEKETLSSILNLGYTGIHIIVLMILFIWALFALKPRYWLYLIAVGAFAACLYIAIYYMQRPAYRALYIADAGAAFWLLYTISSGGPTDTSRAAKIGIPAAVIGAGVVIMCTMLMMPMIENCSQSYKSSAKKLMPAELADFCSENQDKFFVWGTPEKKSGANYTHPLLAPDTQAEKNIMGTGSWGTKSPYVLDKLAAYGLQNPVRDLIDNENAYYIGNKKIKRLGEYYNKWYSSEGERIVLEKVDSKGGFDIWRIITTAP